MATAGSSVAPVTFVRRALTSAVEAAVLTPVVCAITLAPLAVAGAVPGQLALTTYVGLVASTAGYVGRTDPKRVRELDEPRYVNLVRSAVLLLYFNALILTGVSIGMGLYVTGYSELAFVVAALVPATDATLARVGIPSLGLAGSIIIAAVELLGGVIAWVWSDSSLGDALRRTRDYVSDVDTIYGEYQVRLDGAVEVWS